MHGEDVQRNTRPVFEGDKGDGLGGKKVRRKRNWRFSCVWMTHGSCGGGKQKPKAGKRQERAFLGHRSGGDVQQSWDMQSARPAGYGWHHGAGEVAGTGAGEAELGEGEGSSTVEV